MFVFLKYVVVERKLSFDQEIKIKKMAVGLFQYFLIDFIQGFWYP